MEKDSIYKFNQETLVAIKEAEEIEKHPENYKHYNNFQEILDEMKNMEYNEAPVELEIKSKKDLKDKLQEGLDDIKEGRVYSLEEMIERIDKM